MLEQPCLLVALCLAACAKGDKAPEGAPTTVPGSPPAKAGIAATATGATVPSAVPSAIASANITMSNATVDGLKARDLSCRAGGGLFAGATILGGLAKQNPALRACARTGEEVHVQFEMNGSKAIDVHVAASSPAVARCVADALGKATLTDRGVCIATLHVGPE